MGVRRLEGGWANALERVKAYRGPLSVAWVTPQVSGQHSRPTVMTVRGCELEESIDYTYAHLRIRAEPRDPIELAAQLEKGSVDSDTGTFEPPVNDSAASYWVGAGEEYGKVARVDGPSFYCSLDGFGALVADHNAISQLRLDDTLSAIGQPFWPRASDAIFDVLYGLSRHQTRRDISRELIIQLPYLGPYIEETQWDDPNGVAIRIGNLPSNLPSGFALHFLWKYHLEDLKFERSENALSDQDLVRIPLDDPPAWYAVALVDQLGDVVHNTEGSLVFVESEEVAQPLPLEAVVDSFDHFAAVWLNVFRTPLFAPMKQLLPVASLALPVGTRAEFESRLSQMVVLFKAFQIEDADLLDPKDQHVQGDQTLNRLESALLRKLGSSSHDSVREAVGVLHGVNNLRNAVQHPNKRRKMFHDAMSAMGLPDSVEWPVAWDHVRRSVVKALRELRLHMAEARVS